MLEVVRSEKGAALVVHFQIEDLKFEYVVLAASTETPRSCVSVHYLPAPKPSERCLARSSGKENSLL